MTPFDRIRGYARISTASLACIALITGLQARLMALDVTPAHPVASSTIVDDGDAGWTWSGFVEYDDSQLHGGTAHAGGAGNYGVYTFTGSGVDVIVMKGPSITIDGRHHRLGNMQVSIDGHLKSDESTQKTTADYNVDGFSATGLSNGIHVLKIDPEDGWVVVDYIRVHTGSDADDPEHIDGATGESAGSPVTIPEGNYRIYPRIAPASDLDDKDWKTDDGNPLQIWTNGDHQQNQWFHLTPLGSGKYWMAPQVAPQEAVTMLVANPDGTIPSGIWKFTQHPAQVWIISDTKDGWCRLSPSNAKSLALTVSDGRPTDGTSVILQTWRTDPSQEWAIGIR